MTTRELAIYTAGRYHQDQMYGESPYVHHLSAVDQVLQPWYDEAHPLRIASWLHDAIEDGDALFMDLEKMFGPIVANLVYCVTNEAGINHKERAIKTYPKIAGCPDAIVLKLADRIANVEHSISTFSYHGLMYVKEHPGFRKALFNDEHAWDLRVFDLWKRYDQAIYDMKKKFGMVDNAKVA